MLFLSKLSFFVQNPCDILRYPPETQLQRLPREWSRIIGPPPGAGNVLFRGIWQGESKSREQSGSRSIKFSLSLLCNGGRTAIRVSFDANGDVAYRP